MLPSIHLLLDAIVDYAGLFPPAKLGLREAMENYVTYASRTDGWLLGRFVLPASELNNFLSLLPEFDLFRWPLSVIVAQDVEVAIAQIRSCISHPLIDIKALEIAPPNPEAIAPILPLLPTDVECFFEVPWGQMDAYLPVLQSAQSAAKFRTGGITVEAFPGSVQLAQAVLRCVEAQVPFKATAGLHHPLPAIHSLTYESNSLTTRMHGFLNVALLAAIASTYGISLQDAVTVLEDDEGFQFSAETIMWGDRALSLSALEESRCKYFCSFGSCSFEEPVADLRALQLMD